MPKDKPKKKHMVLIVEGAATDRELTELYKHTWNSLLQYDENRLSIPDIVHTGDGLPLTYDEAIESIAIFKAELKSKSEASILFGNEHDFGLKAILGNLEQTMFGEELYKSIEEKAANLLYMVIKDHPFVDGNKRIGCFLFIKYLERNKLPMSIGDSGLTALALLIAESRPEQKDLMVRLIVNFLVR